MLSNDSVTKAPQLYGESADWKSTFVDLDALTGSNVSFNGYGIAEGEMITFPTEEEIKKFGKKLFKTRTTSRTSNRKTGFALVTRVKNGKSNVNWFNLGSLGRQANQADGTRYYLNEFMQEMAELPDDAARVRALVGKTIVGGETVSAFGPEFDKGTRELIPDSYVAREYVPVELVGEAVAEPEPEPVEEPKKK